MDKIGDVAPKMWAPESPWRFWWSCPEYVWLIRYVNKRRRSRIRYHKDSRFPRCHILFCRRPASWEDGHFLGDVFFVHHLLQHLHLALPGQCERGAVGVHERVVHSHLVTTRYGYAEGLVPRAPAEPRKTLPNGSVLFWGLCSRRGLQCQWLCSCALEVTHLLCFASFCPAWQHVFLLDVTVTWHRICYSNHWWSPWSSRPCRACCCAAVLLWKGRVVGGFTMESVGESILWEISSLIHPVVWVSSRAELWLEQKMGWWSRWACTKIMIISSIISIKGRCLARIAIRSPCSSPLFVSFNSAHIEFLFTFRSKMDSLKCLLPFPLALSACAFLNLLWNPFGISYFILTSEGRFSSLMPFQTLCFCSLSGTLPRLAEQKLCRRIQAQWQEEVDEDNDDQGDRNDSEAEAEDFNRGILDEWVVSLTGLRCDVKNQALNLILAQQMCIYIYNYIWLYI